MTDIMHFAKLYRGVVSDEICAKTVSEMDTLEFKEHTFYNANTSEYKPRSGSQELSMSWGNVSTKQTLNDNVFIYSKSDLKSSCGFTFTIGSAPK